MSEFQGPQKAHDEQTERDFETYKIFLDLWSKENPIKTTKLQMLLVVNALLVSALGLSGGFRPSNWFVYAAGAVFNLIWTFSIGRTSLFQDVWQLKARKLRERYPNDPRFSILETAEQRMQVRRMARIFGGIPSKYYLLYSPFGFAIVWLAVLIITG